MDHTTILSRLDALFSGSGGVFLIAAIGALGIVGAHFYRMKASNAPSSRKSKSYRHVVIAPYVEDSRGDGVNAMLPHFSADAK